MSATKIEWADRTWSPVTGCDAISPGCANCWAKRMAKRIQGADRAELKKPEAKRRKLSGYPLEGDPFRVTLHPDRLGEPLAWRKSSRVFVCSMADLFHKDVPNDFIAAVLGVTAACRDQTFLFLTKRAERLPEWFKWVEDCRGYMHGPLGKIWESFTSIDKNIADRAWSILIKERNVDGGLSNDYRPPANIGDSCSHRWSLQNLHLGITTENQEAYNARWPHLATTPATVRFISYEPGLGPLVLRAYCPSCDDLLVGSLSPTCGTCHTATIRPDHVIVGGEFGPGARPMLSGWVRNIRYQCVKAGVPFFFKQWGDWAKNALPSFPYAGEDHGAKKGGRILDGRVWDQLPEVQL